MRVLYTDEYNNFTLIEATAITKVPEETMVMMTILGGNGILVCDDEKIYDHCADCRSADRVHPCFRGG